MWLIFVFFVETGSYYVPRAGLQLLDSSDPLTPATHSAGITGVSNRASPAFINCHSAGENVAVRVTRSHSSRYVGFGGFWLASLLQLVLSLRFL